MRYILLLRGINMMGKNTLIMSEFASGLTQLGLKNVAYYINSGNVFFDSRVSKEKLYQTIKRCLKENHNLTVNFVLLTAQDFQDDLDALPDFWQDNERNTRKEVLFFMPEFDVDGFKELVKDWQLEDEFLYIGNTALFWMGSCDKSTYNHKLIKPKILQQLSIRNEKTVRAFLGFLE